MARRPRPPGAGVWDDAPETWSTDVFATAAPFLSELARDWPDSLVLKLHPATLGAGAPLLAHTSTPARWELAGHEVMEGGVVLLTYDRPSEVPATLAS